MDGWLKNLFGDLPSWVRGLLKEGIRTVIYISIGLIIVCCNLRCIRRGLNKIASHAWIVQKEKGGFVEEFLAERGHGLVHNPCFEPDSAEAWND